MSIEQSFSAAINANPDDRVTQLVYADWLDEQGDPRAEGWRVLIEAGKRPEKNGVFFDWWWSTDGSASVGRLLNEDVERFWMIEGKKAGRHSIINGYETFYAAMDAAAIAWVRCHRDAEYEPDELTERV